MTKFDTLYGEHGLDKIGKPKDKISTSDYVLNDFSEEEMENLEIITNNILDSLSILIDKKLDLFSSTVNNN